MPLLVPTISALLSPLLDGLLEQMQNRNYQKCDFLPAKGKINEKKKNERFKLTREGILVM